MVALIPIGVFFTNAIPSPKTTPWKFALALFGSVIAIAGTWVIADTPAGPILGLIFGEALSRIHRRVAVAAVRLGMRCQ